MPTGPDRRERPRCGSRSSTAPRRRGPWTPGSTRSSTGYLAAAIAVRRFRLRDRTLCQCKGCFECWTKTPGRCGIRDGTDELVRALLASDLLVVASPTSMGMTTALSRRAMERMIPILHPHFDVVDGEIHHRARYERYPRLALLYGMDGCDATTRTSSSSSTAAGDEHALDARLRGLDRALSRGGLPMRLHVLNGSPRGPRSNTELLLAPFLAGFAAAGGEVEGPGSTSSRPTHAREAVRAFPGGRRRAARVPALRRRAARARGHVRPAARAVRRQARETRRCCSSSRTGSRRRSTCAPSSAGSRSSRAVSARRTSGRS